MKNVQDEAEAECHGDGGDEAGCAQVRAASHDLGSIPPATHPPAAGAVRRGASARAADARPRRLRSAASGSAPTRAKSRASSFRRDLDRQQAVLQRVVEEDVGEAARDDRAESQAVSAPRRVLARRPAGEVIAGKQHRPAGHFGPVQHELGFGDSSAPYRQSLNSCSPRPARLSVLRKRAGYPRVTM